MTDTARRETLRQFTDRRVREIATEYSVPMTEVRELYTAAWWYDEWWTAIRDDAREGRVIEARTLDAIDPMHRRHLSHDYPTSIPQGYVNPEVR